MTDADGVPVHEENPDGAGPFTIVCDHASNAVPAGFALGLGVEAMRSHIAWDPGALGVARRMSATLDAPLLWPEASRLVIDCNRRPEAHDLIAAASEGRAVPGNRAVDEAERRRRLAAVHAPYHAAVDACLTRRAERGHAGALVAVHSFTPVYLGRGRPWHVGILFDDDRRLADPILAALAGEPDLVVGVNQPYSPADGVYYTLERHARARRLPAVMIEIRNDLIGDAGGQRAWADRLGAVLASLAATVTEGADAVS